MLTYLCGAYSNQPFLVSSFCIIGHLDSLQVKFCKMVKVALLQKGKRLLRSLHCGSRQGFDPSLGHAYKRRVPQPTEWITKVNFLKNKIREAQFLCFVLFIILVISTSGMQRHVYCIYSVGTFTCCRMMFETPLTPG